MSNRIVIVGGMAGGANAAARARRIDERTEIVIYERSGNVSLANCGLPYYLGGEIARRAALLVQTPGSFKKRYNVEVNVNHEVTAIDGDNKTLQIKDLSTGEVKTDRFDVLILAPGAAPARLNIPGLDLRNIFTVRLMQETDAIFDLVDAGQAKTVALIGAGYVGLEVAEQLHRRGIKVTVVELLDQVLPVLDAEMAWPIAQQLIGNDVDLKVGQSAKAFAGSHKVEKVILNDGQEIPADLVVVGVGVRPELELANQLGLKIGPSGAIAVDRRMETSIPGIFAVGDAVEIVHQITGEPMRIPLAGPANKQGRIAGHFAAGSDVPNLMQFKGALGSSIVRVFDLAAGKTGLSEKDAHKLGLNYKAVHSVRPDHAGYYPSSKMITTKMIFDPDTGKVLGAQIVGGAGVDKRIDVFATLMHFGGTVDDLADLDLCYAPPYNSAKGPVNIAGFVAQNVRSGLSKTMTPAELERDYEQIQLVDLRTAGELRETGQFPDAIHIPVDELRARAAELDKTKPTVITCQVGMRGFLGERILSARGFTDVRNLTGGFHVWNWHTKAKQLAGNKTRGG